MWIISETTPTENYIIGFTSFVYCGSSCEHYTVICGSDDPNLQQKPCVENNAVIKQYI